MLDGTKLKFLRYTNHVRQKDIAEWCGVSIRYVKYVEANLEHPSQEFYNAYLDCVYGVGKPLKKIKKQEKKQDDDRKGISQMAEEP